MRHTFYRNMYSIIIKYSLLLMTIYFIAVIVVRLVIKWLLYQHSKRQALRYSAKNIFKICYVYMLRQFLNICVTDTILKILQTE